MGLSLPDWAKAIVVSPAAAVAVAITDSRSEADKNKKDDKSVADSEKAKWDQDRQIVGNEWATLLSEYSGAFAPRVITADDNFDGMSHEDIYNALKNVNSALINAKADGWRQLSRDSDNAVNDFSKAVQTSIDEHWNGTSGKAAVDATKEFATTFSRLANTFQMVAHGLDLTEGHLAQAKASVPKPDNETTRDKVINALPLDSFIKTPEYRAQEAEGQARYVMKTYYMPGVKDVDGITPILPEPTSTVEKEKEPPKPPGPGGTNPPTNNGETPDGKNPEGETPKGEVPKGETPNPGTNPQGTSPENPSTENNGSSDDSSTNPASTTPASVPETPTTNTDLPKGTAPGTPSTPGGPTTPGSPAGVPSTPGTTPSPGKSLPGTNTPGQQQVASTAARNTTGRPGAPGFPGMVPGARGGRGDDDDEHQTPDYLIYDRGSELLGTQPPALPPGGVIGG